MEKNSGKTLRALLEGTILTLAIYLLSQMLLALLAVRGALSQSHVFQAQAILCGLSVFLGSTFFARRSSIGTLCAAMSVAAIFALLLTAVGLLCFQRISWAGRGGILLAATGIGGVLAGLIGTQRKKHTRKKRRRAPSRKL